jgi:hypothetical protein
MVVRGGVVVRGGEEVRRRLEGVRNAVLNRIVRAALNTALIPVVKAAKDNVPASETKAWGKRLIARRSQVEARLRKSLGKRVRTYRGGAITWGGVGPRKEGFEYTDAAGHQRDPGHDIGAYETGPHPILRPAFESTKAEVESTMQKRVWELCEKEVIRMGGTA